VVVVFIWLALHANAEMEMDEVLFDKQPDARGGSE